MANKFSARTDLISEQIDRLYKDYENDLKKDKGIYFEAANVKFKGLIASYISILASHTTLKNPLQSLLDAERSWVWRKGRESIETQITFTVRENNSNSKNLEIVLSEKPLQDRRLLFSEYFVNDKDKDWYESLFSWEQNFNKENRQILIDKSIPSSKRNVPGLANASLHECKINNKVRLRIFRSATPLTIDLLEKKGLKNENEQFRLTCFNIASQIRLSIEEKFDAHESTSELVILSQSLLSPGKTASAKAQFISSSSDNDTEIYKFKERAIELFQHAFANPGAPIQDDKIKSIFFTQEEQEKDLCYKDFLEKWELMTLDNKTFKYKEYSPLKLTLLSTNHPLNILRHFGTYALQEKNNEFNTALLLGAIARFLEPLILVHPKINPQDRGIEGWPQLEKYINQFSKVESFNSQLSKLIEKLIFCEKEGKVLDSCRKFLIKILESFLKEDEDIKKMLGENAFQLLHALQFLLLIPSGQGVLVRDKRHKPLLRSVAEAIIVYLMEGACWVACKSGKDRTGGALIASAAAVIFYEQNKKYPFFQDGKSDWEHFLKIFEGLFASGHQQKVASENAPGAYGLINPSGFTPGGVTLEGEQLGTQLARLNKPKKVKISPKESFNYRILKDALQSSKDKTINVTLGQNVALEDWRRNWKIYFINGISVKELRNGEEFKDENDLSEFMETYLFAEIADQELKKHYLVLVRYSFHQGGFLHAFSSISTELINDCYRQQNQEAIIGQPNMKINLSWVKGKGIQIEEINAYKEKNILTRKTPSKKEIFAKPILVSC